MCKSFFSIKIMKEYIKKARRQWKHLSLRAFLWRHHPDLNWGIKVLQTSALPLGYSAILQWICLYNYIYAVMLKIFI